MVMVNHGTEEGIYPEEPSIMTGSFNTDEISHRNE